jgi:ABC-type transport system involved in multi-copper enzyme maturation permease subunit
MRGVPTSTVCRAVSPFAEIQLVTQRELRKSFRSVKGILLAALSVAGGTGLAMLFAWIDRVGREQMQKAGLGEGVSVHDAQQEAFSRIYNADTAKFLADCPHSLWLMLVITVWLGPLLVALMNFDGVSGEMQHRSVRFWTVRTRRTSYMLGKYFGAWLVVLAVTLAMNAIVWIATAAVGGEGFGYVFGWGVRFFLVSVPISAAWCGVATLVGSQVKQPMLSLLLIFAAFFVLWLMWVIAKFSGAAWLTFVYPNIYDDFLLSPKAAEVGRGLLGTGIIAVLTTTASTLLFRRRDI